MSERPLPDDPAKWPNDPNELLGVSFGVTPRELRRAYNRLIRIYKPEQYPEHFRRIREAYEYLLRIAEWYAPRSEESEAPPEQQPMILPAPRELPSSEIPDNSQPAEETSEAERIPSPARRPADEFDRLWEEAVSGRPAAAYKRLVQLTQQYAGRVEFYQRLYWLLTLWPDLDTQRVPADWLVQGLLATGFAGPLRELYREVVADDPTEALHQRYEQLLETQVSPELLSDLIEWRFRAAMRLERWDVLSADLPRVGRRFGIGAEQLWLRLLFLLADGAAWAVDEQSQNLLAACRKEITRHEPIAGQMSYLFDRFDFLLESSSGWRKLSRWDGVLLTIWRIFNAPLDAPISRFHRRRRLPANLLRLIGLAWFHPFAEVRELLMEVLEAMAGAPQKWLKYLDEMRRRAPLTLALFGQLLDHLEAGGIGQERGDRDRLSEFVMPFLAGLSVAEMASYQTARKRLLRFCLDESIAPEEIVEISKVWSQHLLADWPLRYICRACRLFWA